MKKKVSNTISIYSTNESIKLLNDENISQYFIYGAYKYLPHSINSINVLILLIGFNKINERFELAVLITLNSEEYENYKIKHTFLNTNNKL